MSIQSAPSFFRLVYRSFQKPSTLVDTVLVLRATRFRQEIVHRLSGDMGRIDRGTEHHALRLFNKLNVYSFNGKTSCISAFHSSGGWSK